MNCPECGEKLIEIDNISFMRETMMGQLFNPRYTHLGCENCNKVWRKKE